MAEGCEPSTSTATLRMSISPSPGSSISQVATTGRPRKSQVWNYFEYDEVEKKSICQVLKASSVVSDSSDICGSKTTGKFPTNLKQHLKKFHPEVYSELLKKEEEENVKKAKKEEARRKSSLKASQQMTLVQSFKHGAKYDKGDPRSKVITRKLAIFIGTSNMPH